jgi:hypothetical protein
VKTKSKKPPVPSGNLEFAQAMHGKHNLTHADKRARRARTRSAAKRRAIKEW